MLDMRLTMKHLISPGENDGTYDLQPRIKIEIFEFIFEIRD